MISIFDKNHGKNEIIIKYSGFLPVSNVSALVKIKKYIAKKHLITTDRFSCLRKESLMITDFRYTSRVCHSFPIVENISTPRYSCNFRVITKIFRFYSTYYIYFLTSKIHLIEQKTNPLLTVTFLKSFLNYFLKNQNEVSYYLCFSVSGEYSDHILRDVIELKLLL